MTPRTVERDRSQAGSALVVGLLIMLIVLVFSAGVAVSTRGGERVATAFKNQQSSFETAIAGLETAREAVRLTRFIGTGSVTNPTPHLDFSAQLNTARAGGTLVNSALRSSFGTTNGFDQDTSATTNATVSGPSTLESGRYQVFLTNAAFNGETVTSATDADDTVTLTAFGSGPNKIGFSIVQAVYAPDPNLNTPPLPGLLTMPGRDIVLDLPNGNASDMDGDGGGSPPRCHATIAITTNQARTKVQNAMTRPNNYHTCNPGGGASLTGMSSVDNFISGANPYNDPANNTPVLQTGPTALTSVSYLTGLVTSLSASANYVGVDTGSINLGTIANPRVNVITGNFNMPGNTNGSGILVVRGNLTMNGTPGYTGAIYVIGTGFVERRGGGNGAINCGGMLIANTVTPDTSNPALVGTSTYTINGGGNSSFSECPAAGGGDNARFSRPLKRISFQQLR